MEMEYIKAKTIVTRAKESSNWFGMDYNMNIYRGCCHGCIYCDSRSDCYRVPDFDTVKAKENALQIIRDDLKRKVKKGVVATGSMSDPYNPFEKELQLTRHALELLSAFGFGALVMTKSVLVTRDADVLKEMNEHNAVAVAMTVTTADDKLSKIVEPNVALSSERFEAVEKISSKGICTGILMMPVLPFIEDTEANIEAIVDKAYESGAKFIYPAMGVTLRENQREYYYDKLDIYFPGVKEQYIKTYSNRYSCTSKDAKNLWNIFTKRCDKYSIVYKMSDIINVYKTGRAPLQLGLFDLNNMG